jgi:hypothetical protein
MFFFSMKENLIPLALLNQKRQNIKFCPTDTNILSPPGFHSYTMMRSMAGCTIDLTKIGHKILSISRIFARMTTGLV